MSRRDKDEMNRTRSRDKETRKLTPTELANKQNYKRQFREQAKAEEQGTVRHKTPYDEEEQKIDITDEELARILATEEVYNDDELPESARAGKGRVSMYEMPSMRFNKMTR